MGGCRTKSFEVESATCLNDIFMYDLDTNSYTFVQNFDGSRKKFGLINTGQYYCI